MVYNFFSFFVVWGLNSGFRACRVDALLLEFEICYGAESLSFAMLIYFLGFNFWLKAILFFFFFFKVQLFI
jgi:hypothetical protein